MVSIHNIFFSKLLWIKFIDFIHLVNKTLQAATEFYLAPHSSNYLRTQLNIFFFFHSATYQSYTELETFVSIEF